jgi:chromosome segregation protein
VRIADLIEDQADPQAIVRIPDLFDRLATPQSPVPQAAIWIGSAMRLERLEINGFKSFSDRSELAFDKGVTAIVGPNGCGKSNVADAITWVMGEQSAKSLRGDRMEDVIFNGSDARKPTASAEVRLRFSGFLRKLAGPALPGTQGNGNSNGIHYGNGNGGNGHYHHAVAADVGLSDTNPSLCDDAASALPPPDVEEIIHSVVREVEVTRRLYRSGESEYLIDGHTCRLKDIHDLLMDTGLGAKAYAIIEQGKIGMILSSRPTDRRQLIEEAAGVTKYRARRRTAVLKLEAAQQNLTRIDDIVFEVEKQRGTLKRQAARARRYQRLRDELRRWEKVLFARKYRELAGAIAAVRGRLVEAREREAAAVARVSQTDVDLGRLRIELVEAESAATNTREAAHALELAINRRQQQIAFDRDQAQALDGRTSAVVAELQALEARRDPARQALAARREAAIEANANRDRAAAALVSEWEAYESAHRAIEGLEADVEAARSEVFSAINSATALRHALEHARAARDRVAEMLAKLDVEADDIRVESERVAAERAAAARGLQRTHEALEAARIARTARESELASARIEHEWRARSVRALEHELAGHQARLKSLEELEAARAGYGDGARIVLAQTNGKVDQRGAVADYVEVEAGYERAVEACLGDLLQHVIVERAESAVAGFDVVREASAGRCGFLIASGPADTAVDGSASSRTPGDRPDASSAASSSGLPRDGMAALSSVMRVDGPYAGAIRSAMDDAWIAPTYEVAAANTRLSSSPIVTLDGYVFRGAHLVAGGGRAGARGILETRREIKELRELVSSHREMVHRLGEETGTLEGTIAQAAAAIAALDAERHKHEKAVVAYDAQMAHAADEEARLVNKGEQLARERRQAVEERDTLDRRQQEARSSIERLENDQRAAEEQLTIAQRRLIEAREAIEDLNHRAGEARAAHAALVERAKSIEAEIARLEEAAGEMEERAAVLAAELADSRRKAEDLQNGVAAGEARMAVDLGQLDALRSQVMAGDEAAATLRARTEEEENMLREARAMLDSVRGAVSELDIARATAEADRSHLEYTCEDAVHASIHEVIVEVEQMERNGKVTPDAGTIGAEEPEEDTDEQSAYLQADDDRAEAGPTPDLTATQRTLTAEEMIAALRGKIDRMGPVNMMAIEQFDELETRHAFLTAERKDLVESIAQTTEAIKRIDETTRRRFNEAFAAINCYFQEMFSGLFGGGRAGLTLLDESDPLESGIEIIAQPPGKRLQSVQLLSGGEKALAAIALMFAMFKYKPSPFCLLDEIDAPLDDANIGRFVEMLRGMQQHTQFIVITHNRKTMEIADRLYGITMEEPGVSKLISVQLN